MFYLELGWLSFLTSLSEAKKQYARLQVPVPLVYGDRDRSSSEERTESRDLLNLKKYVELTDTAVSSRRWQSHSKLSRTTSLLEMSNKTAMKSV